MRKFAFPFYFLTLLLFSQFAFAQTVGGTAAGDDFDGDGIINSVDIDDDNDGISDKVECNPSAKKILFAGSSEDFSTMRSSLFAEFSNNLAAGGTIVQSNIIQTATVPAGFYDGYDMVIFGGAAFETIHANHWAALQTAIQNKTSKAFIIQSDNCCVAANQSGLINLLNNVFGTSYALSSTHPAVDQTFTLNSSNSYASVFTTNSLAGNNYFPMLNVAASDILFYSPSVAGAALAGMKQLPGTTDKNRFVAWFVDGTITQGAPWYTTNQNKIAPAFYNAFNATAPLDCDTDNDGVYNVNDLDSDGDNCPDAKEAGVTGSLNAGSVKNGRNGSVSSTTTLPDALAAGSVGANGLVDLVETVADNGVINYFSKYASYALGKNLSVCADTDTDGVLDLVDIDDDNDGILDVIESPSCFYMASEWLSGNRSDIQVTTTLAMNATYKHPNELVDGDGGTTGTSYAVNFNASTTAAQTVYSFKMPVPVELKTIYLGYYNASTHFNANTVLRLEGSNDNVSWSTLGNGYAAVTSVPGVSGTINANSFAVTQNSGKYLYYRIYWVSGGGVNAAGYSTEVYFETLPAYQPVLNPKAVCTADADSDGIFNHQDLDSDSDGCSDALESGATSTTTANFAFTGTMGANGLDNSLETVVDNGVLNYTATYNFARSNSYAACVDTDGDSVTDLVDIDDDNDGVLDSEECQPFNINSLSYAPAAYTVTNGASASQTFPAAPDGLVVNVFTLDNSFNVRINGTHLTNPQELQFWTSAPTDALFEFLDGTTYSAVWGIVGNKNKPLIRVYIDKVGRVKVYGSRTSGGALEEMRLRNGSFNTINLNTDATNTFQIGQAVVAQTFISGDYGVIVPPSCDDDNDGIPNGLDLDSDGDGCPDAKEAGVSGTLLSGNVKNGSNGAVTSTTSLPNAIAGSAGNYGANGLANVVETSAESGVVSYTSTYATNARSRTVNGCLDAVTDTDSDGVLDIVDIDDDNDGVLDSIEQNGCYSTGANISTLTFSGTAVTAKTMNTITSSNTNSWISSYSTENFALPLSLKFKRPTVGNTAMIGLLPAYGTQTPASYTNEDYKFYFTSTNVQVPFGTTYNVTQTATAQDEYSIDISATGYVTMKINGVQKAAFQGVNSAYKISVAGLTTTVFTDIRLSNPANPLITTCPDTDNDGLPNYLDLDSDGDGCSDAKEAGITTGLNSGVLVNKVNNTITNTTVANAIAGTAGNYGANGFANVIETSTESGTYSGTYTYEYATSSSIKACLDTDGDGVMNDLDIDDDNDGILDKEECEIKTFYWTSPYTRDGSNVVGTINNIPFTYSSTTAISLTGDVFNYAYFPTSYGMPNTDPAIRNSSINTNTLTFSQPVTNPVFVFASVGDGATTVPITFNKPVELEWGRSNNAIGFTNSTTISSNEGYLIVRLPGIHSSVSFTYSVAESWSNYVLGYQQSTYCDTDGDGITNNLDLDSDGDNCPDAVEAGVTSLSASGIVGAARLTASQISGNYGSNGFADVLETTTGSGIYSGTYNYNYAINSTVNACTDTDSDSTSDLFDLDDDNDGVLDSVEENCVISAVSKTGLIITKSAGITYTFNSNAITNLIDGADSPALVAYNPLGTTSLSPWLNFEFPTPKTLTSLEIAHHNATPLFSLNSTYKIQASSDNVNWKDLSGVLTYTSVATSSSGGSATNFSNIADISSNRTAYKYYRFYGISGRSGGGWATEIYFKDVSCASDVDGDGVPNFRDLDSDGDGCSDAIEAGSSTTATSTSTYPTGTDSNGNGLFNNYEGNTAGTINYTSTYSSYALVSSINACTDTDSDGVRDVSDLDDDNDGVLDTVEDNCSIVTTTKTGLIITKPATINYSYNSNNITNLIDGVDNNVYVANGPTGTLNNSPWFNFEFPIPKALTYLEIGHYVNQYLFSLTSTYKIQGSADNVNWTDVTGTFTYNNVATSTSGGLSSNNSNIANFPSNRTAYKYYRIYGISGAAGAGWATEIYFKEASCAKDIDNDGIPNALDLDSDGDGCSDAIEAGSSTTATSTSAYPTGTDSNGNGLLDSYEGSTAGTIGYISTYTDYALSSSINACADSDMDGVKDIIDLDDDNDGVLDVTEYNCEVSTMSKTGVTVSTTVTWGYNGTTIANMVDGSEALVAYSTGEFLNQTILQYNLPSAKILEQIEVSTQSGYTTLGTTGTYNLEGWNGTDWVVIEKNKTFGGTSAPTRAAGNSYKFLMPNNLTAYSKYRIFGTSNKGAVNTLGGWIQEAYFFERSCNTDVDNDGIPNWRDSDSDGDNCPDAVEAGTTAISTSGVASNAKLSADVIPAPYSSNGFATGLETTAGIGIYKGTYTYTMAADTTVNACTDTDGDGIANALDLDDDNDGVLDLTEMNCATSILSKTGITVSSTVLWGYNGTTLANLVNGLEDLTVYSSSDFIDRTILQFDFTVAKALSLIELSTQNSGATLGTSGKYHLQGWNGSKWVTILANQTFAMGAPVVAQANSYTFKMPSNTTAYTKYRLWGLSSKGPDNSLGGWLQEAYFTEQSCNQDIDGDGIPNSQETDSDNDGCPDAVEAGTVSGTSATTVTGTFGANGFVNSLETGAETGIYSGTYTYQIATDATISACRDTDNDGVTDVNDIDDDNDGTLDSIECPATEMITNGSFDTGSTGWTVGSGWTFESGLMANYLDGATNTKLSQTIGRPYPTTRPGYVDIKVDVKATGYNNIPSNAYTASLIIQVNDIKYATLTNPANGSTTATVQTFNGALSSINTFPVQLSSGPFTTVTVSIPSHVFYSSNNVAIGFTAGNDDFRIDNVSVSTSPNLAACDTDRDGIPNSRDLDSDSDGCFDAVEAKTTYHSGSGVSSSAKLTTSTLTGAISANGFIDGIETGTESGLYSGTYLYSRALDPTIKSCIDSDFDGVPDVDDLDDDNDGISDAREQELCRNNFDFTSLGTTSQNIDMGGGLIVNQISTTSPVSLNNIPGSDNQGNLALSIGKTATLTFNSPVILKIKHATNATIGFDSGDRWNINSAGTTFSLNDPRSNLTVNTNTVGTINFTPKTVAINDDTEPWVITTTRLSSITFNLVVGNTFSDLKLEIDCGFDLDSDNDGIPNRLDLDSDGDGCSDANEAYATTTAQGTDGNQTYGTNPITVDATGKITTAAYSTPNANYTSVGSASTITVQPADQAITPGGTAVFSTTITVGSGTTSYQWQLSTDGGTTWSNVTNSSTYTGATTAALTVSNVSIAMKGYRYKLVIAQSNYVCGTISSSVAKINMDNTPSVVDDAKTGTEDTPLTGNVFTNDTGSGAPAASLTVTNFTVGGQTYPAGTTATIAGVGTFVIISDGNYTFTPVANYNGTVPAIEYTATDANGGSDDGALALTITPVNDVPVAMDDAIATNENTPVSGNVLTDGTDDTDVDGNTLTITQFTINGLTYNPGTVVNIPGKGSITMNADGSYTFTPSAGYSGAVPYLDYTLSDGNGGSDVGRLTITVNPVNDAPLATDDIVTINQNTTTTGNLLTNDTDVDAGTTLTVTSYSIAGISGPFPFEMIYAIPGKGWITMSANGNYTFTADPNFSGPVPHITYTLSDGTLTDTAVLDIFVAPVNAVPVAVDDVNSTQEDTPVSGNVLTNDTDANNGDTKTVVGFTVGGQTYPAGSTAIITGAGTIVVNADGTYTFTPFNNYNGTVPTVSYSVSDGHGGTDSGDLVISVSAMNDSPIAVNDDNKITPEDTPVTVNVLANDSDVDGNTILTVSQFAINGITVTVDPTVGGTTTIANVGTVMVTASGDLTFTPIANYNGTVPTITYTVSDGVATNTANVNIAVTPVNDVPIVVSETPTTAENTPLSSTLLSNDTDVENNTLTITQITIGGVTYPTGSVVELTGVGSIIVNADGTYTFTPNRGYFGTPPVITYAVSDGNGGTTNGTLAITVTAVNDPPVVVNESVQIQEDVVATGNVLTNDSDPEQANSALSISQFTIAGISGTFTSSATIPNVGTIAISANGAYSFTPVANYNGLVPMIEYTVSDGLGGTTNGNLTIVVAAVNDAPVVTNDTKSAPVNTPIVENVLTNDRDIEASTLSLTKYTIGGVDYLAGTTATLPGVGTIVMNADGTFTFTPATNYVGSVPAISYTVSDGTATSTGTLSLTITPIDADGDGIPDATEKGTGSTPLDSDNDGTPDWLDADSDNDGIPDSVEDAVCIGVLPCTPSDTDGDGIPDYRDVDSDGDGIADAIEDSGCTGTAPCTPTDTDGDGTPNYLDLDSDGDGITDTIEKGPTSTPRDSDNDGTPDFLDTDSDGDGILDRTEGTVDTDGDGVPNYRDTDSDGDGITDAIEGTTDTDGDGNPNYIDTDSDGDGITDAIEKGPSATPRDTDGDGTPDYKDLDSDNDGIPDNVEGATDADGDGTPNYLDLDSDGDGIPDSIEKGPNGSTPLDTDGDGTPNYLDIDSDGDGIPDSVEGRTDTDGDGIPNYLDTDSDGDGILDSIEDAGCTGTAPCTPTDTDGDGTPNYLDIDSDGDGISDNIEKGPTGTPVDTDSDGTPDYLDTDSDGDGITDATEKGTGSTPLDTDGDGTPDFRDLDSDGDGITDVIEGTTDTDGDGIPNYRDLDSDGDGKSDATEGNIDTDGDGTSNYLDLDSDDDGVLDAVDQCPLVVGLANLNGCPLDSDGDGLVDTIDTDDDNDGILDTIEAAACSPSTVDCDTDGDGIPNRLDLDSDGDGIKDITESNGTDVDNDGMADGAVDSNGVPASANGGFTPPNTDGTGNSNPYDLDSDGDGISDAIEKGSGSTLADTDNDNTPDYLDLDSDGDGITDAVEGSIDTDGDGTPDFRDLDSDGDGITDAVEGTVDTDGDGKPNYKDVDSDGDGISDATEGTTNTDGDSTPNYLDPDSDGDGIPDAIEGTVDTDSDGTPDYLDTDSDGDGIVDSVEDAACTGTAPCTPTDTDGDGIPNFRDLDSDGDGILDVTEGTTDTDNDGRPNYLDVDSDGDGISDALEGNTDTDGDGTPNYLDLDSDGDGIPDSIEKGPTSTPVDSDNDGTPDYLDLDTDGDGIPDSVEKGPNGNAPVDTDNDGIPNYRDLDSDGDGIPDSVEKGMDGNNPDNTDGALGPDYLDTDSDDDGISDAIERGINGNSPLDTDGDGIPDYKEVDSDGDGIPDAVEGTIDTDGDGIPDYRDTDSDNDGIPDATEDAACTGSGTCTPTDTDGDGIPNYKDLDSDADNKPDQSEGDTDFDGDTIPNYLDPDADGDGINDISDQCPLLPGVIANNGCPDDTDADGIYDINDLDDDNDGILDTVEAAVCSPSAVDCDTDGDGVPNRLDPDSDNDGISDVRESNGTDVDGDGKVDGTVDADGVPSSTNGGLTPPNTDGTTLPDPYDTDSDGDGISDALEKGPNGNAPLDTDGDGTPDYCDSDSDNDGIADSVERGTGAAILDTDGDGIPDFRDTDSDNDGITDAIEKGPSGATPLDTDSDGIPNYRDLDSDGDGLIDTTEGTTDTDGDSLPNYIDVDSDGDGITDAIEKGLNPNFPVDTDGDGIPNYKDLDSDGDGIPDAVEGTTDTDGDGIPNYLDLDSDGDGIADSIEDDGCTGTAPCTPTDTDGDGVPNYLDLDSDGDGKTDAVEKGPGVTPMDSDGDGIPDYRDVDNLGKPDVNVTNKSVPVNGNVKTNDPVPAGTTYGQPTQLTGATLTMNSDGTYTFTSAVPGTYVYYVSVCGPNQTTGCPQSPLKITVLDPIHADAPVANDDHITIEQGTATTVNVLANDKAGEGNKALVPSSLSITTAPAHGTIVINSDGTILYTPSPYFIGQDSLVYSICDNQSPALCRTATLYFTVEAAGIPPVTTSMDDFNKVASGTAATGSVLTNDTNTTGAALTASLVTGPTSSQGTFTMAANGTYTFTPVAGFSGPVAIVYEACTSANVCAKATLHILVDPAPVVVNDTENGNVNVPVTGNLAANDVVPVGTTYGQPAALTGATIVVDSSGTYTFTATVAGTYTYTIPVCVPGQTVNCPTQTLVITVTSLNSAPVATADSKLVGDNLPASGNVLSNDTDSDGDTLSVTKFAIGLVEYPAGTSVTIPTIGTININPDGSYIFTPMSNYQGNVPPIVVTITDGSATATAPLSIEVLYDSDNDGIPDSVEKGTGTTPIDTDNDGTPDYLDLDSDNDGIADAIEKGSTATPVDTDNDGTPDYLDLDSDNDGIADAIEKGSTATPVDSDNDGTPDYRDLDSDNDGISDAIEKGSGNTPVDTDNDGTPDYLDLDSDNDGISDSVEKGSTATPVDTDNDGTPDYRDLDSDNDGISDAVEKGSTATPVDTDNDGTPDYLDLDSDNDGIADAIEKGSTATPVDSDNDGTPDYRDLDSDNDGISDAVEKGSTATPVDTDNDGTPDYLDLDSDNDGIPDAVEKGSTATPVDTDNDGTPDYRDLDSDNDGISDAIEKGPNGNSPIDTDGDGIPDYRDLPTIPIADTDGDGVTDSQEAIDGTDPNNACDSVPAHVTLPFSASFLSGDCDGDGLTNGQELGLNPTQPTDIDNNGTPDYLEFNNHSASEDDLEVFNSITNNGDNLNDAFIIRGIENYPDNTLYIYNRWGVEVYSVEGYGQDDKYFRGISEGRKTISQSAELPKGTYFYILRYVNKQGVEKQRSGYLYITK